MILPQRFKTLSENTSKFLMLPQRSLLNSRNGSGKKESRSANKLRFRRRLNEFLDILEALWTIGMFP